MLSGWNGAASPGGNAPGGTAPQWRPHRSSCAPVPNPNLSEASARGFEDRSLAWEHPFPNRYETH